MNNILIHPTYFPSISHFVAMLQADKVTFEMEDNFQKQTNRNRAFIYSANGRQMLNIPIKHTDDPKQKFKDVRIEHAFGWQKQHFKSLEAAYRTSPYFEYFEDEIRPIFEGKPEFMLDLNLQIHEVLCSCLGINLPFEQTTEYVKEPNSDIVDLRPLVNGKKDLNTFDPYIQVFDDKHGYLNNLSILDLLFNEGRHAINYLKKQSNLHI
ncbi:WbqC family protein [Myroides marinus]|uniref:WbqC family protein n=1 Tax=Myroides marinus TaxID=703342 RepID=UPI0025788E07|nr:WbqC family protein [Myroides marinus]MDM1345820.1 WbqC family protein [Myroides marinus]MDM1349319.1 WbqC family protein [Myroides marinus]MDM1353003.1 WbqC family protein [Myroides marinus]MDM1356529.1 WbqC family protein [Myroides marinus]MDM1360889.1 WbqC family protein [Myroides marinus]